MRGVYKTLNGQPNEGVYKTLNGQPSHKGVNIDNNSPPPRSIVYNGHWSKILNIYDWIPLLNQAE